MAARGYRDLNRDGRMLEPYEDWRLPPGARATDLLSRMTLAEKAGAMMHGTAPRRRYLGPPNEQYDLAQVKGGDPRLARVTAFITRLSVPGRGARAGEQRAAGYRRTGASRHPHSHQHRSTESFRPLCPGRASRLTASRNGPGTLGLASIGDPDLVRHFADTARQEYRSVGIHMALSPQADLATEPRWPRINGTFGEDPELVGRMVEAYVTGFQHGAQGCRHRRRRHDRQALGRLRRCGQRLRRTQLLRAVR